VLVYTADSRVLVMRRRSPPDYWQSVTGSLHWDERPAAAAARELFEETGIMLNGEYRLVDHRTCNRFAILPEWKSRYAPDAEFNVEHVFSLCLPQVIAVKLNPAEHEDCLWLPRRQAADKVSSYTNKQGILDFVPPKKDMESVNADD